MGCNQFLVDYSDNSSIHGIKYVFSGNRNWYTKWVSKFLPIPGHDIHYHLPDFSGQSQSSALWSSADISSSMPSSNGNSILTSVWERRFWTFERSHFQRSPSAPRRKRKLNFWAFAMLTRTTGRTSSCMDSRTSTPLALRRCFMFAIPSFLIEFNSIARRPSMEKISWRFWKRFLTQSTIQCFSASSEMCGSIARRCSMRSSPTVEFASLSTCSTMPSFSMKMFCMRTSIRFVTTKAHHGSWTRATLTMIWMLILIRPSVNITTLWGLFWKRPTSTWTTFAKARIKGSKYSFIFPATFRRSPGNICSFRSNVTWPFQWRRTWRKYPKIYEATRRTKGSAIWPTKNLWNSSSRTRKTPATSSASPTSPWSRAAA